MVDSKLLQILCCPESRQSVALVVGEDLNKINQRVSDGQIKNRAGQVVNESMEGLLVREDGRFGYPIRGGIPVMLVDEALVLAPNS